MIELIDNKAADVLICAVGRGDMSALEALYAEMAPAVCAFARSIVKDEASAQDIMQDTFVRVYNSAAAFRPCGLGCAWIMQIARNLSLNALSRFSRTEPDELASDAPATDSTEDSAEARVMVMSALDTLSDAERQVITLHAVSGLKLDAIARIMNEPLGTIKWRHSQAMKKIRAVMSAGEEAVK